ncbi:hypothetical protein IE53DRAFT_372012 [Violaceomyces palustris]|uniref:Uncharacterized protein n=1 Tax=Violaceomyces palustris TaxID=1673888 RepID=A0ACD0NLZ0_9BASI|nr:hypothetical protein IE53DRAFT_372012 [Violaceomyces palustris]
MRKFLLLSLLLLSSSLSSEALPTKRVNDGRETLSSIKVGDPSLVRRGPVKEALTLFMVAMGTVTNVGWNLIAWRSWSDNRKKYRARRREEEEERKEREVDLNDSQDEGGGETTTSLSSCQATRLERSLGSPPPPLTKRSDLVRSPLPLRWSRRLLDRLPNLRDGGSTRSAGDPVERRKKRVENFIFFTTFLNAIGSFPSLVLTFDNTYTYKSNPKTQE